MSHPCPCGLTHPSPHAFTVNGEVFFDPHAGRQTEVVQAIVQRVTTGAGARNLFIRGNRGGGKSRLVRSVLHALAMAFPGFKYVIVRRNMPDLRKNHLIYLTREMQTLGGEYYSSVGQCNYPNGSIGFYAQCEDERDVEKVVGAEAAVLFVDEAPQIAWEWIRLMVPSLRVPTQADGSPSPFRTMTIYGGNPIGESIEDLWAYFVEQTITTDVDPEYDPADFATLELRLEDNPSLDAADYRKQFAGIPAHYRAAWVEGVRMESRTLFRVSPEKDGKPYHYIHELPRIGTTPLLRVPWIQVYRGYDHGFFPDPAACVWFVVFGRRIIAVQEHTWLETEAPDIAASIVTLTRELVGPDTQVAMTCVDPTIDVKEGVVTVMDHLEMHGVPCEPSINDRVLYADAIHTLLGEELEPGVPRFQVYTPGCPKLAKYLPKMRWDEKNPRKMADHQFDHWVVCLAYFAISSGVLASTSPDLSRPEPVWMQWQREDRRKGSRRMAV